MGGVKTVNPACWNTGNQLVRNAQLIMPSLSMAQGLDVYNVPGGLAGFSKEVLHSTCDELLQLANQ